MIKYLSFFGLLPFLVIAPLRAEAQDSLAVEEVVLRALQENLRLRIDGVEVLIAKRDVTIQESAFDTNVFASGTQRGSRAPGYNNVDGIRSHSTLLRAGVSKRLNTGGELQLTTNYARNSTGITSEILNPAHTSDLSVSLRQPLLDGLGSDINLIPIQTSELDAVRSELFLKSTALQIMELSEYAYWDLAYAHEVKKLRTASLEVAQKLLEENQERERVGLATNIDVLQAQVFVATSEEATLSAGALIDNSQDRLFRQMGSTDYPENNVLVKPLPDISTEEIGTPTSLSTILANNPDYLQQRLNIDIWELLVKSNRNSILPTVDLVAGLGFSGLDDSLIDSYGNTLERDGYDWTAGVEFRVPWGQRADKARYQQTRNGLYREKLRLADIEQDIQVINRSNWRDWVTGVERVKAAKLSLNLASEQFDREQTKYESGLATFRELLEARNDQDEANLRFLSSILDAVKAKITNMALDASLPQRYGLSWDATSDLLDTIEEESR